MEQIVLINEARELLNSACERNETEHYVEAESYLVKLRELLNNEPALDKATDSELEQKLNPDDQ